MTARSCVGECCRSAGDVYLTTEDLAALGPAHADQLEPSAPGGLYVARTARTSDGWCAFFKDGRCSVYDRRPEVCRLYSEAACSFCKPRGVDAESA